jgi:hypothetical protein
MRVGKGRLISTNTIVSPMRVNSGIRIEIKNQGKALG